MHCRNCDQPITFAPSRERELARFREFAVLAGVLLLIAAFLYLFNVEIWPWAVAGIATFVLWQAIFKWMLSRWVICSNCNASYSYYGIVRDE